MPACHTGQKQSQLDSGLTLRTLPPVTCVGSVTSCIDAPARFLAFYNDHDVYNSFKGVVLAKEETENIAKALGNNKAVCLQNHGLLTLGPDHHP